MTTSSITTPRNFTSADVSEGKYGSVYADPSELIDSPLPWQKLGLSQTVTGYGSKLNTGRKIRFEGREYRIYATCYSNAASHWFTVKGRRIYVN